MLRSASELIGYVLLAEDGEIGRCNDFLFDDHHWVIRYMVVDTGKWLPGKKVLVSPISFGEPDWANRHFPLHLTKNQIENSPPPDRDAPVSRQYEIKIFDYYKCPYYWIGENSFGTLLHPSAISKDEFEKPAGNDSDPKQSNLRSVKEVKGYRIQAEDGEIGHVDDFIIEKGVWSVRYMIIDTRNWLPGRKVLISPGWIGSVVWVDKEVRIDLTINAIKNGPQYDPSEPINRAYELRLYDYYGRPRYWD